jgi:hypothetical protein
MRQLNLGCGLEIITAAVGTRTLEKTCDHMLEIALLQDGVPCLPPKITVQGAGVMASKCSILVFEGETIVPS